MFLRPVGEEKRERMSPLKSDSNSFWRQTWLVFLVSIFRATKR